MKQIPERDEICSVCSLHKEMEAHRGSRVDLVVPDKPRSHICAPKHGFFTLEVLWPWLVNLLRCWRLLLPFGMPVDRRG